MTAIGGPIEVPTLTTLAMSGKGSLAAFVVEGRGGGEPGKPGRGADAGAGVFIVGVDVTTQDDGGGAISPASSLSERKVSIEYFPCGDMFLTIGTIDFA